MNIQLIPKLLVSDADAAITFYTQALQARLNGRFAEDGVVNHAELELDSAAFTLAQSVKEWGWHDPQSMGARRS